MTLSWIGACTGVVVTVGDKTVRPAITHVDVANLDSVVGWWSSACCITLTIVGSVGCSSGVGSSSGAGCA